VQAQIAPVVEQAGCVLEIVDGDTDRGAVAGCGGKERY